MPTATVTSKGQITLPKTVRELLRVETGDQVDFFLNEHGEMIVRPVRLDITDLRGLLRRPRKRSVSVDAMNAAIVTHHSRKRFR
jgi:AbrB family looped-hinge helix DNA binding protein